MKLKVKRKTKNSVAMSAPELAKVCSSVSGMTPAQVALAAASLTSESTIPCPDGKGAGDIQAAVSRAKAPIEACVLAMIEAETSFDPENPRFKKAMSKVGRDPKAAAAWMRGRLSALSENATGGDVEKTEPAAAAHPTQEG